MESPLTSKLVELLELALAALPPIHPKYYMNMDCWKRRSAGKWICSSRGVVGRWQSCKAERSGTASVQAVWNNIRARACNLSVSQWEPWSPTSVKDRLLQKYTHTWMKKVCVEIPFYIIQFYTFMCEVFMCMVRGLIQVQISTLLESGSR